MLCQLFGAITKKHFDKWSFQCYQPLSQSWRFNLGFAWCVGEPANKKGKIVIVEIKMKMQFRAGYLVFESRLR